MVAASATAFFNMSAPKKTALNITSNWLLLGLNIGISFFMSPFIVNKLGSVYYGIWAIALQFTGYLYLLDFGVRESVIRYTSKYIARKQSSRLNKVLSTALMLYVPITLACVALTGLCAWGVPRWFDIPETHATEARLAVIFVGLTIAQTFLFNIFTGILQGLHRFDIPNAVGLVLTLVRTALFIIVLMAGYKLVALAAIQCLMAMLGGVAGVIAATRLLRKEGIPLRFGIPPRRSLMALGRKVFGYGFYVLLNNIAVKINFASDAIIIGIFMPISWVTPFAIAGSLIDYLRTFITSTAQVFNPLSSQLHTQRRTEELGQLVIRGAKLATAVTIPIALTYAVLGDIFVGLWMGHEYMKSAGEVLLVLGLTQIISAPHYVVSSVLYGMSQHHTIGWLRAVEAAVKLALSIVLVRKLGIVGVALGTAIPHAVLVLVMLPTLICKKVGMSVTKYFIGIYGGLSLAALPFVLGALAIRHYWPARNLLEFFAQVALLCIVYVGAVYRFALASDERATLLRMLPLRRAKAA
jgi:O-antigen/teichoic acid export membrane protein